MIGEVLDFAGFDDVGILAGGTHHDIGRIPIGNADGQLRDVIILGIHL